MLGSGRGRPPPVVVSSPVLGRFGVHTGDHGYRVDHGRYGASRPSPGPWWSLVLSRPKFHIDPALSRDLFWVLSANVA